MKAVLIREPGDAGVLYIGEHPTPAAGPGELLVRVRATALNRADLLQRRGLYPPPPGASPVLGLEMAGEVAAVGEGVSDWCPGDRVCALLPGGGYAEYAVIPAGMALPIPERLSYEQAAAIPEAWLTAYLNLFQLGRLVQGETVLIHAGASGVGTAAIQLARAAGATIIATAGSEPKLQRCRELGAHVAINYREGEFAPKVLAATAQRGVDVILDFVGASYWEQNLASLAVDGRLIIVGTMGGSKVSGGIDLGLLLRRRLQVIGTALRGRSVADKIALTRAFADFAWDRFARGEFAPIIDRVFPWTEVADAHRYMESNQNIGKIILRVES
jgi:tumor protein p53-inducible protein 3